MKAKQLARSGGAWLARGVGLAGAIYGAYAVAAWSHFGKAKPGCGHAADALLDKFMPLYEVAGRHRIYVDAPAAVTLSAAAEVHLESNPVVRTIFKGREWILGSSPQNVVRPRGILELTKSLGWGVLAEAPGREIVMGCATKPWEPNPVFRTLPPDQFVEFQEPGYVKIAWTLRADPLRNGASIFRTETRAIATDSTARRKFRRYWSLLSPGIILIRAAMLPAVKRAAERRSRREAAA
jgi:hypothetical protein